MKAMESYHSGTVGFDILHTDVVEVERRTITIKTYNGYTTIPGNRVMRCRHCGKEWVESITSPQELSQDVLNELHEYFDDYTECKQKKA